MKNNYLTILFFFILSVAFGQKETAHWFFGQFAGLNFNNRTPVPQKGGLYTLEGCATISNKKGGLLFYTDGYTIWDRNHQVMPNGTELYGQRSSTQAAIIVPKPESEHLYYVFTVNRAEYVDLQEIKRGINYSIVDMNLNDGMGDVVPDTKNSHLITYDQNDAEQSRWKSAEKIAATLHFDGVSYWVLTFFVDTFYAFKLDENGLMEEPVKTKVSDGVTIVESRTTTTLANLSSIGYLKLSPNGKKIAIAHSFTGQSSTSGKVFLYDFDPETGKTSTSGTRLISGTYPYGVEFSPKSKKLYVSTNTYVINRGVSIFEGSNVFQFDLESQNIPGSKIEIDKSASLLAGALQLALDGKIYRAKNKQGTDVGERSLAAITKPELIGREAGYKDSYVQLLPGTQSAYGLPPFISSAFILTFDYENICLEDETHFFMTSGDPYDTVIWDFGDGTTSTEPEPYHRYEKEGVYEVTLISTFNGRDSKPQKKIVEITAPIEVMKETYTFTECDVDLIPADGLTTFNLALANNALSLGKGNEVEVFYYKELNTLHADSLNLEALPYIYYNKEVDEPLFAKVMRIGSNCYSVANLELRATQTIEFEAEKMIGCNLGDGTALFDLRLQGRSIIRDLGLPETTKVSFHNSKYFASLGHKPFKEEHIGTPSIVYIRLENDNICSGIGSMELDMPILPRINQDETISVCATSFPFRINAGVDSFDRQNYTYEWISGEETYEIEAVAEGEYHLTITDKETLCSIIRSITIRRVEAPIVDNVELHDNGISHSATVNLLSEGDFEYSLNNPFGPFQSDPTFVDLPPGSYSAFIRDRKNCEVIEKKFFIFGFPKFFTPNSDGDADVWEIKGLNPVDFEYSDIQIFNRFGKLLASIPPNGYWDGFYNGRRLPSDDYWFTVTVTDAEDISTTYIKHFSLISE